MSSPERPSDAGNPSRDLDRFLIALAKFLGENPTPQKPLADLQICDDWFLSELLLPVLPGDGKVLLTLETFNRLMLASGRSIATAHFFKYFFEGALTVPVFEEAVEKFRIKAIWLFGNFRFGYKQLATSEVQKFETLIERTTPRSDIEFHNREVFTDVQDIPESDLGFLGYVSGAQLDDLQVTVDSISLILEQWGDRDTILARFGLEKQQKLAIALKKEDVAVTSAGIPEGDKTQVSEVVARLKAVVESRRSRQSAAREIGRRNTQRYLTLPHLDVYVATSMRSDEDYIEQHRFIKEMFSNPQVKNLKLRYFDPTASFDDDRIKKGLIEALMLRRANVTIYIAGAEDTMGKDSELAATLAQGKPVIVYVQATPKIVHVKGRDVDMDTRAKIFRADHPLGLQISVKTGVAHGIIVVRTKEECAKMLRKVLLHDLDFSIKHEGGNFKLVEEETGSVLRVMTDDALLSHSFWTYFRHIEPEPDI
jgi:hypothetical protein